jgi:hypothetical protein
MFSPEDIGTFQIIRNNDNIKFIYFSSRIKMSTSKKGLEKLYL